MIQHWQAGIRVAKQLFEEIRGQGSSTLIERSRFASSLESDEEAISAALTTEWSSSAVKRHVNRLKLIKRQVFERGKLDLLQKRVCHRAVSA